MRACSPTPSRPAASSRQLPARQVMVGPWAIAPGGQRYFAPLATGRMACEHHEVMGFKEDWNGPRGTDQEALPARYQGAPRLRQC